MCVYGARMGVSDRDPSLPTRVGAVVVGEGRNPRCAANVPSTCMKHVIFRFWRCSLDPGRVGAGARLSMCAYGARMGVSNRDPRLPTRVGAVVVGRGRNPRCAADVPST